MRGRLIDGDGLTASLLKKSGIKIYTEKKFNQAFKT